MKSPKTLTVLIHGWLLYHKKRRGLERTLELFVERLTRFEARLPPGDISCQRQFEGIVKSTELILELSLAKSATRTDSARHAYDEALSLLLEAQQRRFKRLHRSFSYFPFLPFSS